MDSLPRPMRSRFMRKIAAPLMPLTSRLSLLFPKLDIRLKRAGITSSADEYISLTTLVSLYNAMLIFAAILVFLYSASLMSFLVHAIIICLVMFLASFLYFVYYPKMIVLKKIKGIDATLVHALRHILIKVRSGVPLYDTMVSVSKSDYGAVSDEFGKAIKEMQTGVAEADALDKIAAMNPSQYFRRTIWQMTNAMRSGADIADTLDAIERGAISEQKIKINSYGSEMNPLAVIYMMFTVIMPTLGITFLIIISSLTGFALSKPIFYFILGFLAFFQFMFLGLIKSRRPVVGW